jgi:hypothetical protein
MPPPEAAPIKEEISMKFEYTAEKAKYRLGLKKKLKAAGVAYDKEAPTATLEAQVREAGACS